MKELSIEMTKLINIINIIREEANKKKRECAAKIDELYWMGRLDSYEQLESRIKIEFEK